MDVDPSSFYNSMAEYQHLIFKDWESSLEWQASVFGRLLEGGDSARKLRILDCACGIGTQSLGLARRGHTVFATDLSAEAVAGEHGDGGNPAYPGDVAQQSGVAMRDIAPEILDAARSRRWSPRSAGLLGAALGAKSVGLPDGLSALNAKRHLPN